MQIKRLDNGAVEVSGFDITNFTKEDSNYIRELLLKELIVVIKKQDTNTRNYARLIHEIGDICNWNQMSSDFDGNQYPQFTEYPDIYNWDTSKFFQIQAVTGKKTKEGQHYGIFPLGKLDWHCNLNGPDRADGVALQGIRGVEGTRTSWMNTAIALKEMPEELYERVRGKYANFRYNFLKWSDVANEHQRQFMLNNQHEYKMWLEQENAGGVKGIYLYTNNDCEIEGDDGSLFQDLQDYFFQEKFLYHHDWEVGDIVLSDQLLTLHKRRIEVDEVFENRLLNRLTFKLSNTGYPQYIVDRNRFDD
jgi:alpha-ketoglutarate-dependent taurine dioxygenase